MRKARRDFMANNKTGVTGVCEVCTDSHTAFIASWRDDDCEVKQTRSKWFCYDYDNDDSRDRAWQAACDLRRRMLRENYDEY